MSCDDNAGQTSNRKQSFNGVSDEVTNGAEYTSIGVNSLGWEMYYTDYTSTTRIDGNNNNITSLIDNSTILFEGTEEAYGAIFDELKGEVYVIIPDNSVASSGYFNISDNIVIYFTGDTTTFINIDINEITTTSPSLPNPGGTTRLRLNGSQGISNTYVGDGCYVFTPDLGGGGTEVIPEDIEPYTSKIVLSGDNITIEKITNLDTSSLVVGESSISINSTDGTDTSTQTITPQQIVLYATDGSSNESFFDLDPANYDYGNRWYSTDGTNTATVELDVSGVNYGNRLYATDGTDESSVVFSNYGIILSSTDGTITSTIELDAAGNNNGNRLYATDGTTVSSVAFDGGYVDVTGTDGTTTGGISVSPTISSFGVNDTPNDKNHNITFEVGVGYIIRSIDTNNTIETKLYGDETFSTWEATSGASINSITLTHNNINISNLPSFDDDTAASGLTTGDIYQTTGGGASPLNVAGILMIKQ